MMKVTHKSHRHFYYHSCNITHVFSRAHIASLFRNFDNFAPKNSIREITLFLSFLLMMSGFMASAAIIYRFIFCILHLYISRRATEVIAHLWKLPALETIPFHTSLFLLQKYPLGQSWKQYYHELLSPLIWWSLNPSYSVKE